MFRIDRELLECCGTQFILAAKNEQAFDRLYYRLLGLSSDDYNCIPRPSKWIKRFPWTLTIIRLGSRFFTYAWSYVLFYVHVPVKVVVALVKQKPNRRGFCGVGGEVVFAICDRSCAVLSRVCGASGSEVWLSPGGVVLSKRSRRGIKVGPLDPKEILEPSEIMLVAILAFKVHRKIVADIGASMSLQTYVLVEWLLMFAAIIALSPKKICTAEHHDKWAVLADIYCAELKRRGGCCELEIAQHGKEYRATYEMMSEIVDGGLPYRLRSISKLHIYGSEQQSIFEEYIISPNSLVGEGRLVVEFLKHQIDLVEVDGYEVNVLIVGHPICEKFQAELFRFLDKDPKTIFFYKPHPTAPAGKCVELTDWTLIADHDFFPRADLVISYPSTLVDEYESEGVAALIHSLDAVEADLTKFSQSVNEALFKLRKNK